MSFGFSASDILSVVQLAWNTLQNSRKACGEYAELTLEVHGLHAVLQRMQREAAKADSPINNPSDLYCHDFAASVEGCSKVLDKMSKVLIKYNSLSDEERTTRRLWQAVRFGNGELVYIADLRARLGFHASLLSLTLNLISVETSGRIEQKINHVGGSLRRGVNRATAQVMATAGKDGSVLTTHSEDDIAAWKELRRELHKDGFKHHTLRKHKATIKAYLKELGDHGILDEQHIEQSAQCLESGHRAHQIVHQGSSGNQTAGARRPTSGTLVSTRSATLSSPFPGNSPLEVEEPHSIEISTEAAVDCLPSEPCVYKPETAVSPSSNALSTVSSSKSPEPGASFDCGATTMCSTPTPNNAGDRIRAQDNEDAIGSKVLSRTKYSPGNAKSCSTRLSDNPQSQETIDQCEGSKEEHQVEARVTLADTTINSGTKPSQASEQDEQNVKMTSLHRACERLLTDDVRLLLRNGSDPNALGPDCWTAIHWAALNGGEEIVQALLDQWRFGSA